jgi:hypothetical protein
MAEIPDAPDWLKNHQQAPRKPGFQPGQSGNPARRAKGSKNKRTLIAEEFEKAGSEVARVVVEKARAGDLRAADLLLQRIEPPLKPQSPRVTFAIDPDKPIADQAKALLGACSKGEISPEQFRLLMDCLSAFVGMRDVETFMDELKRLKATTHPELPGGVLIHQ